MGVGRRVERAMGCHLGGNKGAKMGKILVLKVVDEKNQENEKNHFSAIIGQNIFSKRFQQGK